MRFFEQYGPWALVAGASEGTGEQFARQLAARGLNLILIARRTAPLEALAQDLRAAHGVQCLTASIDLAAADAAARMAALAAGRDVGLLILNAGADPNGSTFLDGAIEDWADLAMRNVITVMRACHHFGQGMKARGKGGLMLVGSGACYAGLPGVAVYGGTKAFDLVFGEALWAELQPHGVHVLNYILGRTDTPAHRKLLEENGMAIPEGMATSEEVARLGLERLAQGPVLNWGLADDEAGFAGASAADRRARILAFAAHSNYTKRG